MPVGLVQLAGDRVLKAARLTTGRHRPRVPWLCVPVSRPVCHLSRASARNPWNVLGGSRIKTVSTFDSEGFDAPANNGNPRGRAGRQRDKGPKREQGAEVSARFRSILRKGQQAHEARTCPPTCRRRTAGSRARPEHAAGAHRRSSRPTPTKIRRAGVRSGAAATGCRSRGGRQGGVGCWFEW